MALDVNIYTGEERQRLVALGRQYGSEDTLAQAEKTLSGLEQHGAQLKRHGFSPADTERLKGARDALINAGVKRTSAQGAKKITNKTYDSAIKEGKFSRESARSVLEGALREMRVSNEKEHLDATKEIETTLRQTGVASSDANILANQLELLQKTLENKVIAGFTAERGGPETVEELPRKVTTLREVSAKGATPRGTPVETELLDLIDGIIIELTRSARKAASVLAKAQGQPAILASFELDKLYQSREGSPKEEEEGKKTSTQTTDSENNS